MKRLICILLAALLLLCGCIQILRNKLGAVRERIRAADAVVCGGNRGGVGDDDAGEEDVYKVIGRMDWKYEKTDMYAWSTAPASLLL